MSLQINSISIKQMKKTTLFLSLIIVLTVFQSGKSPSDSIRDYIPEDIDLYNAIVAMDKEFFDAYNNCDLKKQAAIYADDIEFFHDKGGLMTSKQDIIDGTEKNICGKVTRTLINGTIEVYPINNYGAVQIGFHKFYNNQEPDAESIPSKFIAIWHFTR